MLLLREIQILTSGFSFRIQLIKCEILFIIITIIIIIMHYLQRSFSHQLTLMIIHWSFSHSKSPQTSWTLLSILAVLNNVVWMVSTRPPTSKSSRPLTNPFVTVPKAPITIGTILTVMFHSFLSILQKRSRYLSFFSHSFSFILWSAGTAKFPILHVLFFCWLL